MNIHLPPRIGLPADDFRTRSATARPTTWKVDARTVEAVTSTGAGVARRDGRGPYVEVLDLSTIDPKSIVGLPVLDGHATGSVRHTIGVVVSASHEPEGLVAVLRIGMADDIEPIAQRIAEGLIRNVSIGYAVTSERESVVDGRRVKTVVPRIREISLVVNGADPGAQLRVAPMPENIELTETISPTEGAEAARVRALAELAKKPNEWAEDLITRGLGVDDARTLIHAEAMDAAKTAPKIRTASVGPSNDDPSVVVRRQTDALVYRAIGGELPDDARQYVGSSFKDIATSALQRAGVSTRGLGIDETFQRAAMGTSDFPLVVSNAAGKIALERYRAAASEMMPLVRQRTLPDFKTATAIRMGELGELPILTEHGEFRAKSFAESGETMQVETYGGTLEVTRRLLRNDDANLFGDVTSALADAASATVSTKLAALLTNPGKMADGKVPFHADRGNLAATGSDIDVDGLDAARKAMRVVKGIDGKTIVGAAPKYIVCGPDAETDAEKVLASIYAATPADANVFSGRLQLLVEPRLTGTGWFTFADPARLPCLWLAYLAGAQGPQIQRSEAWDTLGMRFRVFLDFGVGWSDWRGAYKNSGA